MGSKGRLLFDLNEPPTDDEDGSYDAVFCFQPQRAIPSSSTATSDLFSVSTIPQGIVNNRAFSHVSSVSGFQPFVRHQIVKGSNHSIEERSSRNVPHNFSPLPEPSNGQDVNSVLNLQSGSAEAQAEKEEGEWSDAEGAVGTGRKFLTPEESSIGSCKHMHEKGIPEITGSNDLVGEGNMSLNSHDAKNENISFSVGLDHETNNKRSDVPMDAQEGSALETKQREIRGVEANHALRYANNLGKRPKLDQQKDALLGKKRSRQTMFLDLKDVKQAGALKTSTPRRHIPAPTIIRTKGRATMPSSEQGDKQFQSINRDIKQSDVSSDGGNTLIESNDLKNEANGENNYMPLGRSRSSNSSTDLISEGKVASVSRHGAWKSSTDTRIVKSSLIPGRKPAISGQSFTGFKLTTKKVPSKKVTVSNTQYQDTSVERLLREVTNEKFWHHPEDEELQCVPGCFESVEEYIRVFEPLLFEECRAQLYSTWEESSEAAGSHVRVLVKSIERRERGWFDVILHPLLEHKWVFKEGDVAVLSIPKPASVNFKRNNSSVLDDEETVTGRVCGTIRRHMPIDPREHTGAILHFYNGDSFDSTGKNDDHILGKLQPGGVWYLILLGSLATIQREYVALHAFRRVNLQMQNAILQPSPDQFPKYEEQPPAMTECFTPNFVDYLRKNFNGPQLAAIQWAAMHTAAGTSNSMAKRQDPWPFTLVQGPPGTGKTHTVWGMLNVIHLVQYQHYYAALLKKLSPESYKQVNENSSNSVAVGSIDEVLQSMDQNLFRILPKLCPKPRMLVCAPSNAATDELLSRVLDRGFIDGEMKIYRPDVARVGVESQTRAAQAVSVERRTEQLLLKTRDEVCGWMHNLRVRETQLAQQMTCLQKELNTAAATGRSQGSVGVHPDVLVARDQNRDALLQNLAAVVENRDKILVEMSRLVILEGRFRPGNNFNLEEARASLEASFANEAEIVFTTVSSSGRKLFSRLSHGFDMVVIDEAAQASEVAVLPPLSLGAARCVLVGDPQQLPATVISKAAGTLLYSRSLFERFQLAGCPTMLLSVQYRMHPQIRDFPSRYFYQGRLTDSDSVVNLPEELYYKDMLLRPFVFYDISHGRESHRGGSVSYQNSQEAQFCVRLYEHLQKTLKTSGVGKVSVGIITPYKLQLKCLQREFKDILNSEEGKDIYINTVDAFQGQERDVIIISCVRASSHGVGFVADIRRMNVALTRARRALWVMGNANALLQSEDWAALIADARQRNCYLDMDSLPKDFFPTDSSTYGSFPSKIPSARGLRSGQRYISHDSHVESTSGTPSEDDEKSNISSITRNGSYHRLLKPGTENSFNDFDLSSNRTQDAWQQGLQKKQNAAGVFGRRDL